MRYIFRVNILPHVTAEELLYQDLMALQVCTYVVHFYKK